MPDRISENRGIRGTVIVRSHPAGTIHLCETLIGLRRPDLARELLKDGKVEVVQKNMIVWSLNYGFDIFVQFLISGYTGSFAFASTLGIGWGEIGTGATTPVNTDTALTTPTNRAPVSYAADLGFNEAQIQFFFPDAALTNGTYTEFGTFIGGSSSIGSGNMFNHALFASAYSKSAGTDTTVEVDFSFSNS
jgi:hypothetical protein